MHTDGCCDAVCLVQVTRQEYLPVEARTVPVNKLLRIAHALRGWLCYSEVCCNYTDRVSHKSSGSANYNTCPVGLYSLDKEVWNTPWSSVQRTTGWPASKTRILPTRTWPGNLTRGVSEYCSKKQIERFCWKLSGVVQLWQAPQTVRSIGIQRQLKITMAAACQHCQQHVNIGSSMITQELCQDAGSDAKERMQIPSCKCCDMALC